MPTDTTNIIVTGGGRGIGRATCLLAGQRKWNVGVNFVRDHAAAEATVEEVKRNGGNAIALQGDIAQEADVLRMFDSMEQTFGTINGVVINAAIVAPSMTLAEMSVERIRRVIETNVLGAYIVAREAARRLPRSSSSGKGSGSSIVFVSSGSARLGSPNEYVDYAGSKGAVDTLTTGLSKELGPSGIRVNAVRPGHIKTEIHATSGNPNRAEEKGKQVPLGRPGEAREVGEAIVWLLDEDKSGYVTGAHLDVTGGR